jgi:predicted RNase H-like nuclease (RuvC/YqgF family)
MSTDWRCLPLRRIVDTALRPSLDKRYDETWDDHRTRVLKTILDAIEREGFDIVDRRERLTDRRRIADLGEKLADAEHEIGELEEKLARYQDGGP